MLENIKSSYILKNVFCFFKDNIKFKMIKYNKTLQNKMGINLSIYKIYSQKYIIYENKSKGREYNKYSDQLIYEGEFLSGEKHGKGKEYNEEGVLIFEGEYKKGEKFKGKEYNIHGKIIFEGEYLNGKKMNGKGKEYDTENYLIFEGEYLNGKRWKGIYKKFGCHCCQGYSEYEYLNGEINGKGKIYSYHGELLFEGEYLNGRKNGKCREYNKNGQLIFEGEYLNGVKWDGKGYDNLFRIILELKNGKGFVKEYYGLNRAFNEFNYNQLKFEGEYLNGKKWDGKGYDRNNNIIYEMKNGKGHIKEYNYKNKLIFEWRKEWKRKRI